MEDFVKVESAAARLRDQPGELVRTRLAGQRRAMVVDRVNCLRTSVVTLGNAVLGIGYESFRLLVLVRLRRKAKVGVPTAVSDTGRPQDVAEVVDLKRERVCNAWIGQPLDVRVCACRDIINDLPVEDRDERALVVEAD